MPLTDLLRSRLPRGAGHRGDRRRHARLLVVVAVHLPVLAIIAILSGRPLGTITMELVAVAVLLAIAGGSQSRPGSVALGLAAAGTSAIVDELSGGVLGSLHGAVLLGAVATLLDWWAWWPALGRVVAVAATSAELPLAATRGLLVLLAAVGQLWWWQLAERELEADRAEAEHRELKERALVEQLREVARIRNELISVVGHEFRTPLTAIRGFAKTLAFRGEQLDEHTIQVCLRTIDEQAARLERIVGNVLLASDRHPPPQDEPIDLGALVHELVSEQREATQHDRTIRERCDQGAWVRMHPEVAQALALNLLDNAMAFAPPGSPVLVRVRRRGGNVLLEVGNRGGTTEPIAEADLERLFEPFVQGDSSDTRPVGGIGLGLHVVRRLAESHGGGAEARLVGNWILVTVRLPFAPQGGSVPPTVVGRNGRAVGAGGQAGAQLARTGPAGDAPSTLPRGGHGHVLPQQPFGAHTVRR